MKRIFLPVKEMVHIQGHDMCRALQKTAGDKDLVILISLSGESQAVVELGRALRDEPCTGSLHHTIEEQYAGVSLQRKSDINSIQMPG